MRGRRAAGVAIVVFGLAVVVQGQSSADLERRALEARASGRLDTAIPLFQQLVSVSPGLRHELLLAETLAWAKRFPEAEKRYAALLQRFPDSREAHLGLARVLLWEQRYAPAAVAFAELLRRNPKDADALEGRATVAYWSGDYRTAARLFDQTLAIDPRRETARTSLAEIRATSRPEQRITAEYVHDDQPFDALRLETEATLSSDPLTRWSAVAGGYRLQRPETSTRHLPFLRLTNRTTFPSWRLGVDASLGVIRYSDGATGPIGTFGIERAIPASSVSLRFARKELLATATSVESHPHVDALSAGWRYDGTAPWLAAAEVFRSRFFDGNRGAGAWAYALRRFAVRKSWNASLGMAAALRDTAETRFAVTSTASRFVSPGLFAYEYRREYAPYYTPQDQREVRLVLAADATVGRSTLRFHADGGAAHERATSFGPASGSTSLPPTPYRISFERSYRPFEISISAATAIGSGLQLRAGVARSSTSFYRANTFDVSLVRHR